MKVKFIKQLRLKDAKKRKQSRCKERYNSRTEKLNAISDISLSTDELDYDYYVYFDYDFGSVGHQSHKICSTDNDLLLTYQDGEVNSNSLVDLQYREITPEDYELLLILDESLACKTVSEDKLKSFEVVTVDIDDHDFSECCICMGSFIVGQNRKILPKCGHSFHELCIDQWLLSASDKCPLDGSEV